MECSMMGTLVMPMGAADMQRMQELHGVMPGRGMDAMGKSSFDDMMKGMGEMHQELDGQLPSGDPHHPTPTP